MKHAVALLCFAACADEVVIRDVAPSKVRDRSASSQEAHDNTPLETPPKKKRALIAQPTEAEVAAAMAPIPLPNVTPVLQEPKSFCKNVGAFIGLAERGDMTLLAENALRDAMRRVAAVGGNYAQLSAPQYFAVSGTTYGATVLAIGFTCADGPLNK